MFIHRRVTCELSQGKQEPFRRAMLHVEGRFSFQSLLAVALSADSAITRLCVVYD